MNVTQSELLSAKPYVAHGFCGRESRSDSSSILGQFGFTALVRLKQVHSSRVVVVDEDGSGMELCEGDAMVTAQRGICVAVATADCVPILLSSKDGTAVAAVHAGWRGTASEIVLNTLDAMKREFCVEPGEIRAAVGPSIKKCCYEIGHDVASIFLSSFNNTDEYLFKTSESKYVLDIAHANKLLLSQAGVRDIDVLDMCTQCNEKFYSYRREGKGVGHQLSFIGIR